MAREPLTEGERTVLDKCLTGEHPLLQSLREQLDGIQVAEREYTGVGVYVRLAYTGDARPCPCPSLVIDDVLLDVEGLEHGAASAVFVTEGVLSLLEMYSYGEPWPARPVILGMTYRGATRQLSVRKLAE